MHIIESVCYSDCIMERYDIVPGTVLIDIVDADSSESIMIRERFTVISYPIEHEGIDFVRIRRDDGTVVDVYVSHVLTRMLRIGP